MSLQFTSVSVMVFVAWRNGEAGEKGKAVLIERRALLNTSFLPWVSDRVLR